MDLVGPFLFMVHKKKHVKVVDRLVLPHWIYMLTRPMKGQSYGTIGQVKINGSLFPTF